MGAAEGEKKTGVEGQEVESGEAIGGTGPTGNKERTEPGRETGEGMKCVCWDIEGAKGQNTVESIETANENGVVGQGEHHLYVYGSAKEGWRDGGAVAVQ